MPLLAWHRNRGSRTPNYPDSRCSQIVWGTWTAHLSAIAGPSSRLAVQSRRVVARPSVFHHASLARTVSRSDHHQNDHGNATRECCVPQKPRRFRLHHTADREEVTQERIPVQCHLRGYVRDGELGRHELTRTGQTGLGKSTLINTIFASHLIDSKGRLRPDEPVRATTEIQTVSHSTSRKPESAGLGWITDRGQLLRKMVYG